MNHRLMKNCNKNCRKAVVEGKFWFYSMSAMGLAWIVTDRTTMSVVGLNVFGSIKTFSIASKVSSPSINRPKTVYFRSNVGCFAYVKKNCD